MGIDKGYIGIMEKKMEKFVKTCLLGCFFVV